MTTLTKNEIFIEKSNIKHNNKYDYSLFEYTDSKTSSIITCPIHGNFTCRPNNHLFGKGCKYCATDKIKNDTLIQRTNKFISDLNSKYNNTIEVIGNYINNLTPIKVKCKLCNNDWTDTPAHLLFDRGCYNCVKLENKNNFLEITKNNKIRTLTEYINAKTKINCECEICNHKWIARAGSLLNGDKCKKCANKKMTTSQEDFINKISKIHQYNILVIGEYINAKTEVKVKCIKCNHEWSPIANSLIQESGCPICNKIDANIKSRKTHEEFINDVTKKHKNRIIIIGNYITGTDNIEVKCTKCNHIWYPTPNSLTHGSGCPICKTSKGEKIIIDYLNDNNIIYIHQKTFKGCKLKNKLRFDFYLPDYNMCIEYDGAQHFIAVKKWGGVIHLNLLKKRDEIKTQYCKDNNITLTRIKYTELKNIENILIEKLKKKF